MTYVVFNQKSGDILSLSNLEPSKDMYPDLEWGYFDEEINDNYHYFMYFLKSNDNNITIKLRFILNETFNSISYSNAMSNINTMINSMADKLNIDKDNIKFKNLIIGETVKTHIDYYFEISNLAPSNSSLNYVNTKISDLNRNNLRFRK